MEIIYSENVCVYIHINSTNKEVFYVGIGNHKRPYTRQGRSIEWWEYTKSIYFNYEVQILYEDLTYYEAGLKEKELIAQIGRKDKNLGTLLNKTNGGEGCNSIVVELKNTIKTIEQKREQEKTDLILLKEEIISHAIYCKNKEEFTQKYYADFVLAKRLNIESEVDIRIGEVEKKIQNEIAIKKLNVINSFFESLVS